MKKSIIHVYTVCWNEELILPYFISHYRKIANKIIFYDNHSTDSSHKIINDCEIAELRLFDTNDQFDDFRHIKIKNSAYKESVGIADYVIVVDVDEFLYHRDIENILIKYKADGVTLFKTRGYDMVSWFFPTMMGDLIDMIKTGRSSPYYSKKVIFDPELFINYQVGSHTCSPSGKIVESGEEFDFYLLHYHYIGFFKTVLRHSLCKKRLPKQVNNSIGYQFRFNFFLILCRFVVYWVNSHDIYTKKRPFLKRMLSTPFNYFSLNLKKFFIHKI